ncbi:cellulose 1,4-beta-cellobiosidase [Cystobacter fuscus DSM 2262]|uniref:Cellulose 1,4-beta-cellobiosidase n=1 Tax=Cystobacter fuscus (strain ATCC 25194 / DSM 2262 / NBRC 100088 / M29) TaxID=1242864 RepID=S9QU98_CYSF2|nr:fibronectin type III domain-containing protein [Cystobacter fuscus]EPX60208.1 cellulose 1,4-beta-cellobiosidase [Cystobacter fuscus DSM 2262]
MSVHPWKAPRWLRVLPCLALATSACQPDGSAEAEGTSTALAALESCTGVSEWNASTIYPPGSRVVYKANLYEALVSIWSADPVLGTASGWYKLIGPCTTSGGDTLPPTQVTGLKATSTTSTQISLAWNAASDNVGVTGYLVFRNGTQVGTATSTSYTDGGLSPSTQYSYTVKAKDNAGNLSTVSSTLVASTAPGTTEPPPPTGSWHPSYLALGTVYEPFTGTDRFFTKVNPLFPAGKRLDYGYLYLNGGSQISEWHDRAVRLANKSKEQGMTPIYVVYGIGGNTDSPAAVWGNLQSAAFLTTYFKGLRDVGQTATGIIGTGRIGYVIEPDTLGYIQQQYGPQYGNDPAQMPAATYAVYDSGVLQRGVDPTFPNTLTGLVQSINYTLRKYTPKAFLGWQLNLWAAPGAPSTGIVHATEVYGLEAGKTRIQENARANAGFALKAGVKYGNAEFISIDKYGLDGAGAAGANPNDPATSLWFWNADLWNNYLLFVRTLKETLSLPVVLWQVPAGHINGTLQSSPTAYNASGTFPLLSNAVQQYEESAAPYFFGDRITLSGNRLAWFSKNLWGDPKVSVSGSTVTWGSHIPEAANAGVVAILMGAGVGVSTRAIPQPGSYPEDQPTEGYYWISRVQDYYRAPVTLP